jgi:hypothetical protein
MRFGRPLALLMSFCVFSFSAFFSARVPLVDADSPAFVRVIHASPFVGTADVFLDGNKLLSSFAFGAVTGYAPIPPGPHKVQIALVGKGPGAAVIMQTLAVTPGLAYTVAAIGATPTNLSLQVFVDDNSLNPGTAKLRVYHLSPNLGPLNVTTSGNTLLQNVIYQQASNYLKLSAGSYMLDVSATQSNTTLPLTTTLQANMVTSIFTVGMLNGTPKLELVTAQVPGLPSLPGTGSDPNAIPTNSTPSQIPWLPWSFGALALFLLGAGIILRRHISAR